MGRGVASPSLGGGDQSVYNRPMDALTRRNAANLEPQPGAAVISADSPLRDIITEELRQAILSGRYKPGQRLIEDRLAQDFEVSRHPVREALRSLAAEGLVALTARRGATVAAPSAADGRGMIEVRATLEAGSEERRV